MYKNALFENYKATVCQITKQASKYSVDSTLLKPTKKHRTVLSPQKGSK